jgi:hypothetical protein
LNPAIITWVAMQKLKSSLLNKSLDRVSLFFVSFAVLLGAVVRFYPILLSNFPLNDGGLFYQMTQDILQNNFSMPVYTSYNVSAIPFSYPPLAFYLMAFIHHTLHIGIISQLHYLPALISTLTIPALYFLSRKITDSKEISLFAVIGYALMPQSFVWLIMGGGITRSLGILFAILALLFVWQMFRKPSIFSLLLTILFCSLTILSHPAITWFLFLTALLIGLMYGRNKTGILYAILTITGILLITSPWWIVILQRFGLSSFLNASQTSGLVNLSVILFSFTGEPFATIIGVIAFLGIFAEITRRRYFLLIWLIVIALLSPRGGQWLATIPASMLFGSGVVLVLVPGLVSFKGWVSEGMPTLMEIFQYRIVKISFSVILVFALFSAMVFWYVGDSELKALSSYDRQAMQWVSQNTEKVSKFVVLTGEEWPVDLISEWFPALSMRYSVSTVQGSEWLPDYQFNKQVKIYDSLQSCATKDFSCLLNWAKENSIQYTYLYLSKSQLGHEGTGIQLSNSPAPSDYFQLVYENPGVLIYKMIGAP